MKKSFLVISAIVCVVAVSCAVANVQGEQLYKNLRILPKDITKPQLDSVMKHFTTSLNVKCNFCHVRTEDGKEWNFPADDNKHKLVARDMMRMTNELNKNYFDLTGAKGNLSTPLMVTCYTCHNGMKEPATKPPQKEAGK
jgi:hypothetical protein